MVEPANNLCALNTVLTQTLRSILPSRQKNKGKQQTWVLRQEQMKSNTAYDTSYLQGMLRKTVSGNVKEYLIYFARNGTIMGT